MSRERKAGKPTAGGGRGSYRGYFLTLNNPQRYMDDLSGLKGDGTDGEEELREGARTICDRWMDGGNGRARNPETNGVAAVFERGEGGTFHAHVAICGKSPILFETVQRRFPHAHIEPMRGSAREALAYLDKGASGNPKAGTQLCEPVSSGEWFRNPRGGQGADIFEELDQLVGEGLRPAEIFARGTREASHANAVERHYNALLDDVRRARDHVRCVYHFGASGTGKSHVYDELVDEGRSVCFVSDYDHPFDNYDGQEVLFLDELRKGALPVATLLNLMETRIERLPARYAGRIPVYVELHITSPLPPEGLMPKEEDFEQLRRRLDEVVYHYRETAPDGTESYLSVSVAARDYHGALGLIGAKGQGDGPAPRGGAAPAAGAGDGDGDAPAGCADAASGVLHADEMPF